MTEAIGEQFVRALAAKDATALKALLHPDIDFLEQQAYYETDGDQISWLRIMCAGYQPAS